MSLIARFHLGSFFGNTFFCCNIIFVFEAVGCPAFFYGYFSHWQSYNLSFPFNNLYISYISCIILLIYHYSFFMLLWTKCRSTENSKFHMKKKPNLPLNQTTCLINIRNKCPQLPFVKCPCFAHECVVV